MLFLWEDLNFAIHVFKYTLTKLFRYDIINIQD